MYQIDEYSDLSMGLDKLVDSVVSYKTLSIDISKKIIPNIMWSCVGNFFYVMFKQVPQTDRTKLVAEKFSIL